MLRGLTAATAGTSDSTFQLGGDLTVKRLGFGAMRLTGDGIWGWPPDRENAKKVLRRAIELGANLIDTADAYGPDTDELLIAEALHPYPKGVVIATKGGITRPGPGQWVPNGRSEYLSQCVDKSLKRLKLERIDLYQLHAVDRKVPIEESLGALKAAQDAGKIRHVGLSNVGTQEIERARKVLPIVSVQNEYNIADRSSEKVLLFCEKRTWDSSRGFRWAETEVHCSSTELRWRPKRNVTTPLSRNLPSPGSCKNRRSCCRSREQHRSRISRRTWPPRNFSSVRTIGTELRR